LPPGTVALPVGTATPAATATTIPGTITSAATPTTAAPGYTSNGPGVLPNGGRGIAVPSTPAVPTPTGAVAPASPRTSLTTTPVNPQFNRLFGRLSTAVPASTTLQGYNSNGPGVLPNGGRSGP
jgi:hypothetical protein